MRCHAEDNQALHDAEDKIKILLMGNPNVGKSVIFSKLTGREVLAANYSGTTVSFTRGTVNYQDKQATLIDVPGTYSLSASSEAEKVAVKLLSEGAHVVVCVLDATNLERNLNLALWLKEHKIPIVFALNLFDVAKRRGIEINVKALQRELNAPVISTVAIRNIGLQELLEEAWKKADGAYADGIEVSLSDDDYWQEVGRIVKKVQKVGHRHPTFLEKLGDLTLQPFPGIPIALLVLAASLGVVVGGGKGLRALILLPLINDLLVPLIRSFVSLFITEGLLFNVLVGEYGMLVKGFEWPFALILPYVFLFYVVLSILEDSGFLPRLGVLVDGVLRRLGVQGGNIIPIILGYGCAVPAVLGTRAATSHKERLIVTAVVALAVPCAAQTGAFVVLLGDQSLFALLFIYMLSFAAIVGAGVVMNRLIPGQAEPMLLEIPNLLKPDRNALFNKIWLRTRHFMLEAQVPMFLGIGFAALVAETGVLDYVSVYIEPLVVSWLGLPAEASLALMLGIVRRELAVLPLLELNLSTLQLIVGSIVALFYLPCLSVLAVLIKEFGAKIAVPLALFTIVFAFLAAGVFNQAVRLAMTVL